MPPDPPPITDEPPTEEALRARYLAERDKRLRDDGIDQYIEITDDFAHYADDPYATPVDRGPLRDEVTVALVGGGFAGLLTGAALKEAGIDDVRIIEKGGDFGGTWYWNRYPGAQCDTASFVYMPLLEETGHMPTEKYAHGARDPRTLAPDRPPLRPLRQRLPVDHGHRDRVGQRGLPLDHPHRPG